MKINNPQYSYLMLSRVTMSIEKMSTAIKRPTEV
jgi:hypothetical protein